VKKHEVCSQYLDSSAVFLSEFANINDAFETSFPHKTLSLKKATVSYQNTTTCYCENCSCV